MNESIVLEIETITKFPCDNRTKSETSAYHDYYTVIWIKSGNVSIIVDSIPLQTSGSEILFISKNRMWSLTEVEESSSGYVIWFSPEYFCRKASDVRLLQRTIVFDIARFIEIPQEEEEEAANILSLIHNEHIAHKEFCSEIIRQQLSTLILLSERTIERRNIDNYLQQEEYKRTMIFKRLIDDHYMELRSVSKYAELMCISHKTLIASVLRVTGTRPKQLLNKRIMSEAKRLLVYCSWSVQEIGTHLGFDEETNFIKFFKQQAGVTPTEYRNEVNSFR